MNIETRLGRSPPGLLPEDVEAFDSLAEPALDMSRSWI
jgi:hypothetical protein